MKLKVFRLIFLICLLIACNTIIAQIPNAGFETWETDPDGNLNPAGWETTNDNPDVSVDRYTPAKQGSFAMRVKAFDPGFMAIGGIATTSFAYSQRPSVFSGWVKATILPGDAAYVIVSLWKGDSIIAAADSCTFIIDSTISDYTHFSYTLAYQSALVPDSASIMVVAGKAGSTGIGTEIILDDIAFELGTGTAENGVKKRVAAEPAYPNPASGIIFLPVTLDQRSVVGIEIFQSDGTLSHQSRTGSMEAGRHNLAFSVGGLSNGIYHYRLSGEGFRQTGTFTVCR